MIEDETDAMAPVGDLRALASRLPRGRLVTFPGAGHGLSGVLDAALDEAAEFVRGLSR
jgi:pimeloyl-ACP methyl ester carboxylesterase